MRDRLRLGVIGCGFIGSIHLANARTDPRVDLRAVCDANPDVARRVAEESGVGDWSVDGLDLCRSSECDALVIATHPVDRPRLALEAISHGKHVLLEKPVATTAAQVRSIMEAAQQHGVVAAVNLKFRAAPAMRGLKEAVPAPRYLSINVAMPWTENGSPHMDPAIGGGLLANLGTHVVDFAAWLMGSPVTEVACRSLELDERSPRTPDLIAGQLVHENSGLSNFCIGDLGVTSYASKWLVHAGDGRSAATVTGHGTRLYVGDDDEPRVVDDVAPHEVGTATVMASFVEAALGKGEPVADAADGLVAATVVEAAERSTALGGAGVPVPRDSRHI